jgi:HlyD family secretion protein
LGHYRIGLLSLASVALAVGGGAAQDKPKPSFHTEPVRRGTVVATIQATGTLQPEEVVDVGAQVSGQIDKLGVDPRDGKRTIDYGTPVEVGTVLAQLDSAPFRGEVERARATLQRAKASLKVLELRLRQAERDLERAKRLEVTKAITHEEVESAQSKVDLAKAEIEVGKADVALAEVTVQIAQTNLGYTTIKSPIKGVVIDRRVNVGQTVKSSLDAPSLFLIAKDLKRLQVWTSVNEADIGHVRVGQDVRFTVKTYPKETFVGKVTQVRLNAQMTDKVVTYTVVVETDNSAGKLLPYLTADVHIEVETLKDVLRVPNAALRWRPRPEQVVPEGLEILKNLPPLKRNNLDTGIVWVEEKGKARPVKVRLGITDGTWTGVVTGDLAEGASVIVEPPEGIRGH